jgi:hypothetical protein
MRSAFRPAALALLHAAVAAATSFDASHAQGRSVAEELRVNVHAGAARIGGELRDAGVGPGVSASYGNSRRFNVFITWDRHSLHDGEFAYTLQHVDAGVRVHARSPAAAFVPFGLAAYTWRKADYGRIPFMGDTLDTRHHGTGLTVGGGALYYIAPRLAFEVSGKASGGAFDRITADGLTFRPERPVRATSLRLNAGVTWFPDVPRPR